ncbi:hypothetical protein DMP23_42875 [Amycolatopsis sp. A1MSW2902]|uniref:hypothetical protein n=1 Tax=Amycolatopsis sp. A1MSW2902 TaxID=687413 RepID=UPI00307EB9D0
MTDSVVVPVPGPQQWTWGPSRTGLGGYGGTCAVGPLAFAVSATRRHGDSWDLKATSTVVGAAMASSSWESDDLACTPDGIVAELAARDVLRQLVATTRRRVAEAARFLEEFDALAQQSSP